MHLDQLIVGNMHFGLLSRYDAARCSRKNLGHYVEVKDTPCPHKSDIMK